MCCRPDSSVQLHMNGNSWIQRGPMHYLIAMHCRDKLHMRQQRLAAVFPIWCISSPALSLSGLQPWTQFPAGNWHFSSDVCKRKPWNDSNCNNLTRECFQKRLKNSSKCIVCEWTTWKPTQGMQKKCCSSALPSDHPLEWPIAFIRLFGCIKLHCDCQRLHIFNGVMVLYTNL